MKNYIGNVWSWLTGFARLRSLDYRKGWNAWTFGLVYAFNIGSHVLLSGGAVQTWSRAFYEWRISGSRAAKLADRLLQRILGDDHGEQSHPAYWGTTPCRPAVRVGIAMFWLLLLGATL
jgi:hypothetical protein